MSTERHPVYNTEKLRTIRLYGKLGTKFGRVHHFYLATPGEAIRALCSQVKGFADHLADSEAHGVAYSLFVGKQNLSKEQLEDPPGNEDIRIAPILVGSKRAGLFQVIVGVALIALAFTPLGAVVIPGMGALAPMMMGMGASLMLGGIAQLLSPQPQLSVQDSVANTPGFSFNGPVNTEVTGHPVPIAIGECIIGSAVISAGMYTEDMLIGSGS